MINSMKIYKTGLLSSYTDKCINVSGCAADPVTHKIIVSATDAKVPLLGYTYDKHGTIHDSTEYINLFGNTEIGCIGNIGIGYGVTEKDRFNITYFDNHYKCVKPIMYHGSADLYSPIISAISDKIDSNCFKDCCYKLVGYFTEYDRIYFFVTYKCCHYKKKNFMYVVKANIELHTMTICNEINLVSVYDLYTTFRSHKISEEKSKMMKVSSVTHHNNLICVLTHYNKSGYLWTISMTNSIDFIGSSLVLVVSSVTNCPLKLTNYPRGVSYIYNDMLVIICDNQRSSMFYYIIKITDICHKEPPSPKHNKCSNAFVKNCHIINESLIAPADIKYCGIYGHTDCCQCHMHKAFIVCGSFADNRNRKHNNELDIYNTVDYSKKCHTRHH